ncbi:50S ribosomal protein L35 [Candidatus Zixiibacteriota bacterium]
MPKMKSNRAAMKRFSKTGTGKIKRRRAYGSHLLSSKTTKRKRTLRKGTIVSPSDSKKIDRMLS